MRVEASAVMRLRQRPGLVLAVLAFTVVATALVFLTVNARGDWSFVLALRGKKLAAICLVAMAVAVTTVIFQTVTQNRILTPSIMGFDALYVLMQTCAVFFLGSARMSALDPRLAFVIEAGAMVAFSLVLYRWLFLGRRHSLHLLLLVGVVCGLFFRSLTTLFQRIIDPNEFVVLQDRLFASFSGVAPTLLTVAAVVIPVACLLAWRASDRLDLLLLGRDHAVSLGLDYRRSVTLVLLAVALLVSTATALVGPLNGMEPVSFFGLLVASITYAIIPSFRHRHVLPGAVLTAILVLLGGQLLLEQLLGFDSAVGIVIEFVGGITFLTLLLKRIVR